MAKNFQKAERNIKIDGEYKLLSYASSSESVEMTDGTDLQTKMNSVDKSISDETTRAKGSESTLTTNLNSEISRAKSAESTLTTNLNSEITRAQNAENTLSTNKLDKTTVASSSTLGLIKSGTDITVDTSGNVSVNDNSHKHTVSNISDLTATASEINILDGITATTQELNYVDGVTSNIQTQLDSKSANGHTHETDKTLSVSDKPADAAAVGEALANVKPGDNSVILTQAEYDALSDEEKSSDTTYYISDGDILPNAFSVLFTSDNYTSTNVGDALDEVKTELVNINTDKYLEKTGDTTNNTVTFTSGDNTNPTGWTDVTTLTTGEKHSSLLNKISTMFKNVRWLYKMLGSTDISAIGDGTVTGGLSTLNSNLENMFTTFTVPIAGTEIKNYYAYVPTNIDLTKYKPISIEYTAGSWCEKCFFTIHDDGENIAIGCIHESYTISALVNALRVICVNINK